MILFLHKPEKAQQLLPPPQMFVALIFWFQFYCGFSGSAMIDQWYLIFFNLMFSAFPQLITGTLDKDVSAETLQRLPQLYVNGQNSEVRRTEEEVSLGSNNNTKKLTDGGGRREGLELRVSSMLACYLQLLAFSSR